MARLVPLCPRGMPVKIGNHYLNNDPVQFFDPDPNSPVSEISEKLPEPTVKPV